MPPSLVARHCFGEGEDREEKTIGTFKTFVETCAVPLKLQKAYPEQQYLQVTLNRTLTLIKTS